MWVAFAIIFCVVMLFGRHDFLNVKKKKDLEAEYEERLKRAVEEALCNERLMRKRRKAEKERLKAADKRNTPT